MSQLLSRYFEENFFIIPIKKGAKVPIYRKWNENPISYNEAKQFLKHGYNIGVVSGEQSVKDGYYLYIIDIDNRPTPFNVEFYRNYNTYIQFTPHGYHIFLRIKSYENKSKLEEFMKKYDLKSHRTTLEPHHEDNTFDGVSQNEHDKYFADTIRGTSMYVLLSPSKVNEKSYWWLDNMKGDILCL